MIKGARGAPFIAQLNALWSEDTGCQCSTGTPLKGLDYVRPQAQSTTSAALFDFFLFGVLNRWFISAPGAVLGTTSATARGGGDRWGCCTFGGFHFLGAPGTRLTASATACSWFLDFSAPGTGVTASAAACWFFDLSATGTGLCASAAAGGHGAGNRYASGTQQAGNPQPGQHFFHFFVHKPSCKRLMRGACPWPPAHTGQVSGQSS